MKKKRETAGKAVKKAVKGTKCTEEIFFRYFFPYYYYILTHINRKYYLYNIYYLPNCQNYNNL